ncbi:peptidase A4 family-domain-containing protein [Mycena rosella]|uniref:Peptidase A4 family-domain-containing protein n=1 Tax=Mycena rosella TaxID=1033263 RepID=A0AAD7DY76_MYCRO|nr:peptidase A4 family-domain-containing protein [Mycena rosella]
MFFAASLLSYALLATTAFAANPRLEGRIARRRDGAHMSGPMRPAVGGVSNLIKGNTSQVAFSSNWAGAAFELVYGTFVVPTPKVPSGKSTSGTYAASAWVGIDGDTCGSAILQTGIDFTITNGRVSYDAWYEYFPAFATDFTGIPISAGNTIKLTVTASSTTAGTAVIENVSTGVTVTKALTSTAKLCMENAEWIVEDFEEGSSLVPFANFGTVTFTGAQATTASGSVVGPSGSVLIDLEQGSTVLTSVSSGTSTVTVTYV